MVAAHAEDQVGRYELRQALGRGGGGSVFAAWDPELTREVAVKLVVAADPALQARALAEGQALAQLSHPNVVPVFDVGAAQTRVYLVMELVRGTSLRSYAESARPREILAAYRQCAHGLAAVHAARLVHRDFKPDNAVIGSDGRVRVVGFGAQPGDSPAYAGVPGYMSPEQRRGEPVTAAADQYALAASLREALSPMPRWLDRIVARALAEDPAARFASMRDLDAALARDPATRWRRRALVAVPAILAALGYAFGVVRDEAPAPCSGAASELAAIWSLPQRTAALAHLGALDAPYPRQAAPRLAAGVDDYRGRWIASRRAGCLSHRRGALSTSLYDRQLVCLANARHQLASLVELVGQAGADRVDRLIRALPELPDPARCGDPDAPDVAPPPPAHAARVAAIRERLDRARVRVEAEAPGTDAELEALLRDAAAVGYRPLLAAAQLLQGTALLRAGKEAQAEAPLAEASTLAFRVGDYAAAVEAFARHAWILSRRKASLATTLSGIAQIAPLAEGLPPQGRFAEALLHNNLGSIWIANDRPDRARAELERAVTLSRNVDGPGVVELTNARLNLALVTDDVDRRVQLSDEAAAFLRARLGDDHPASLDARIMAALARSDPREALPLLSTSCAELARLHPAAARDIAECSSEVGWLELAYGDRNAARRAFQRVTSDNISTPAAIYLDILDGELGRAADRLRARRDRHPAPDAHWYDLRRAGDLALAAAELARAAHDLDQRAAELDAAIRYLSAAARLHAGTRVHYRLTWAQAERAAATTR
ncbi:MAG TPA: serine/threonine-protein kinase [Kofleriaceae bacterium]|nr:serine/threonine-protein kinase [Kofleriaceae bacterium]